jgi:ppGpp synthetase/RelA/SpoT-type nucleotidyltranferase
LWTQDREEEIRRAFAIANNWRDPHTYRTRSIRYSLLLHIRDQNLAGFTAACLKRMQAIRRKLRRMQQRGHPLNLNQLQDLGGCRVIMNTMDDVRAQKRA